MVSFLGIVEECQLCHEHEVNRFHIYFGSKCPRNIACSCLFFVSPELIPLSLISEMGWGKEGGEGLKFLEGRDRSLVVLQPRTQPASWSGR